MFLAPLMLVFVGAGVIPLVLHYLSRSRQVEVRWGAMMFLEDVSPRRSKLHRLRQAVVLALRCLAIVLLAVALARPVAGVGAGGAERLPPATDDAMTFWESWLHRWLSILPALGPGGSMSGTTPSAVLIVLDTSGSTTAESGPTATRIGELREAVSRIIARLDGRERLGLMTTVPPELSVAFTTDHAQLATRLPLLSPGDGSTDLIPTLDAAARQLGALQANARTLVLVTDRQVGSFARVTSAELAALRQTFARQGVARLVVVTAGSAERDNVAVRAIDLNEPQPLAGRATRVRVVLHNHGLTPRPRLPVRLVLTTAEGVQLGDETVLTVDLPADASGSAETELVFPVVGPVVLRARIDPSGATFDDERVAVAYVRERPRVLLADPNPRPLLLALAPDASAGRSVTHDRLTVTRVEAGRLPVFDLDRYAAVVIPQLQELQADEARALIQYVYGGGGLVLGLGPLTSTDALTRLGELLPATVGPPTPPAAAPSRVLVEVSGPAELRFEHLPPLAPPEGPFDPLPGGRVDRHYVLEPAAGRTVLRLSDQSVLAVAGRFGRGRVLVVGTPLDGPWNDLFRSIGYVPTIQALVMWAGSPERDESSARVGDRLAFRLPAGVSGVGRLEVEGPGGSVAIERIERGVEATVIRTAPVYRAGLYRLRVQPADPTAAGITVPLAVVPPAEESELAADDDRQRRVIAELGGAVFRSADALTRGDLRPGRELWFYFVLLAAVCLGVETLLTRRWDAGT